jgi:hypothetical protein
VKLTLALVLALVLAGCGEGAREHGSVTLWVTRDRGAQVVFTGSVPAGLNGIQTVERKLKVTTRYGGRYVQSINGVAGSLGAQRDWFYFVDGIEGDRSAAEVRIHAGAVLWWDFRHWTPATMSVPVVAGAFPHPFVDGGRTSVVAKDRTLAAQIAREVHGVVGPKPALRNTIRIGLGVAPNHVAIRRHRGGFELELGNAVARRLAADPTALRYRF